MAASPHILLIMADQLVPFLMGAYDHPVVQTPNLDALVAGGVRFDAAYTPYPLCAPARAALLTGKYASTLGCYDNAAVLPTDEPKLTHYLTNAGYETVLSGKMHFIGPDQLHGFRWRLTTDVFPANITWVPTRDLITGRFPGGGTRGSMSRPMSASVPGPSSWSMTKKPSFGRWSTSANAGAPRPPSRFSWSPPSITRTIPSTSPRSFGTFMKARISPYPPIPRIWMKPIRHWIAGSTRFTRPIRSISATPIVSTSCAAPSTAW